MMVKNVADFRKESKGELDKRYGDVISNNPPWA